ncbi:MAG: Precorrin-2 C(20)-methyltransferase [Sporanaerobacter sp.]|jgi:precorrin-2/cobalt-factor-2 C20-methyltransferase|uniref:precorrin-2 C(20)-methyltransferase n=1 Tax=Sporanaerobacter sp. TaxID=2010183 RepID=UPI003A0FBB7C
MKKLYGIGTGPGDKELLTLKAVKEIELASVIFAPNNKGKNMALDTVEDFIHGKKIVLLDFSMGKVGKEDYINAAEIIYNEIPEEGTGAYLTIGDSMIYSTFIYIMKELEKKNIQVEIIPGIPSFVAGAAKSKTPLILKGESFLLCDEFNEEVLDKIDSICVLKTLENKKEILNNLENKDYVYRYMKRVTLENEEILVDRDQILKDRDYISFIFGRRERND